LSLIVIADWFNYDRIESKKYYNIVTFEQWQPFMGGSNTPTLNSLLNSYHISFGQGIYSGDFEV
jgi:membrane-bound transcription factor site-1 protease